MSDIVGAIANDVLPFRGGFIAMLKVYLDKGQKSGNDDEVMCAAATVFKPTKYRQFHRPWDRMVREWNAKAFHATDFYPGAQEFKRDTPDKQLRFERHSRELPSLIAENIAHVTAIAFRPSEFRANCPKSWENFGGDDPHSMAVYLCLLFIGFWLIDKRSTEHLAYFQESGDPSSGKIAEMVEKLRQDEDYESLIRVKSFSTVDKGTARGLEASDFCAWHWNKDYIERCKKGLPPRKDWAVFAKLVGDKRKAEHAFITGPDLQYLFNRLDALHRDRLKKHEKQTLSATRNAKENGAHNA